MNLLRRLVSRYRLHSLILLPVLAFSFIGYKVFNVDATTIPTFQGWVGQQAVASAGDHLAGFGWPAGVAIDTQGNMYVVDGYYVQKFDSYGNYLFSFGGEGTGDGKFGYLDGGITTDTANNIYSRLL